MPKGFDFGAKVKIKSNPPVKENNEPKPLEEKLESKEPKDISIPADIAIYESKPNTSKTSEVVKEEIVEKTRLNGFRFPIELDRKLESYCFYEGLNKTDVVIDVLEEFFKDKNIKLIPVKKRRKRRN